MPSWLSRLRPHDRSRQLYGSIVAAARESVFYRDLGVPDSLAGRFEMITLHLFLLLERLKSEGEAGQKLGRNVVERLFAELDDTMREWGVGDLTVPKQMHEAAGAFYGRLKAYEVAMVGPPDALASALVRNVYAGETAGKAAPASHLAAYVRRAALGLQHQPFAAIAGGEIVFPDPGKEAL